MTTAELKDLIYRAEDALAKLDLGVAACVTLTPDALLWFRKQGNLWRLIVVTQQKESCLLVDAPIPMQVLAASHLRDLHTALIIEHDRQVMDVEAATAQVRSFLASFTPAE